MQINTNACKLIKKVLNGNDFLGWVGTWNVGAGRIVHGQIPLWSSKKV